MFPLHENYPIDLHCKSVDLFLYVGNIGCLSVPMSLFSGERGVPEREISGNGDD